MIFVVGAYATAPRPIESHAQFRDYVDQVLELPDVDGLEIPYLGHESPWNDVGYLHETAAGSAHVLTSIPSMVAGWSAQPALGLAAADDAARHAAIRIVGEAWDFVQRANRGPGGKIVAVELHTAPPYEHSSLDAFRRSLDEVLSWDWGDVSLMIEHCDAPTGQRQPAKGFRSLAEETAVASECGLSVALNWGRSAIETRTPEGVRDHIKSVAAAGRLGALVFSGTTADETVYGPAWADAHVPIRGWSVTSAAAAAAATSLLTEDEVVACVGAALDAPELQMLGVKVAPPQSATTAERVELVAAHAAIVASAIYGARVS